MVILILGLLLLIGLTAINFIELKNNKTLIMAGIVMAMLLLNIIEELTMPDPALKYKNLSNSNENHSDNPLTNYLDSLPHQYMLNASSQLFKKSPVRSLNKQERTLLNTLLQKIGKQKNSMKSIMVLNNIEEGRFRAIFKDFQNQIIENQKDIHLEALQIDYGLYAYQSDHLEEIVRNNQNQYPIVALVERVSTLQQLSDLQNFFLSHKQISLLFLNPPEQLFELSSLSKWAQIINFQGNYISQVLENHPPRLVEICNKYRTIDYSFYILSQSEPLSELCTKLPTNRITQCIRKQLSRYDEMIPYSKVRQCWGDNQIYDIDGVIFENGMVGVKKDYFYAGKVDKKEFMLEGEDENGQKKQL